MLRLLYAVRICTKLAPTENQNFRKRPLRLTAAQIKTKNKMADYSGTLRPLTN